MFPDCWSYRTLGEIVVKNGLQIGPFGSQLKASEYVETLDGIPVVMPKDMLNGRIITNSIARVNPVKAKQLKRHHLKAGDIIFGRRGEIGRCALVTEEEEGWLCGSGCLRARLYNEVYPEFFAYQMQLSSTAKWLESNAVGQTMLNLNTAILSCTPVIIPPIAEQKKIAEVLGIWDSAIAKTEKLITAIRKRKKVLVKELLSGKKRLLADQKEWTTVKQGEVATFYNGRAYKLSEWELEGTPVIRLQNLTGRGEKYYYSKLQLPEHQYVNNSDLLYMWSATFGPHIWQGEKAIYHYHIWKVVCSDRIEKIYLYYLLDYLTQGWMSNTNGMGLLHLTKTTMENQKIPLPSLEEQRAIANVLTTTDRQIELNKKQLELLKIQKRGLMQKLLTGEWRVKIEETATQLTEVKE